MTDPSQRTRQTFHAALSLDDPMRRAEYLEVACRGDQELREEVDSLLSSYVGAGDFMEARAVGAQSPDTSADASQPLSESIGPYKLLQQIGEGGFGTVYMAEQQQPVRRRVALKIIKLGMDTKQVIGRFEAERQALAILDHPNIAKVFDAGSTDQGRPYFVMELVRGEPITDFCDVNRFDTTERLELFVGVCSAIQHAHQKGIIHRDIKPTNVLVTLIDDRPVPKVIDFGIAKATEQRLTERTLFTEFKQFLGTPAYMSPEQASLSGTDIDTRSDVYSLGILLYELLVGVPPFDDKQLRAMGYEELCRVVRETVPPIPSSRVSTLGDRAPVVTRNRNSDTQSLRSKLRGEIDWIVMKSLEKDRARRYDTTSALAADIRRYLDREPVLAGPPSTTYRLRKFVQRNRASTISALAIVASLLFGAVAATVGMLRAIDALDQAKTQTNRAIAAETESAQRAEDLAEREVRMRWNLYVAEMDTAKREFDQFAVIRCQQLLEKYLPEPGGRPDLRGFEWRWLWNQCHRELFHFTDGPLHAPEAGATTRDMRFSADGKWLVTGATDGHVRLWDVTARREVWRFKGGTHCNVVDISPDGRLLLTGYWQSIVKSGSVIWDISNPSSPVEFVRLEQGAVRFLPDSTSVVATNGAEYDLAGNQLRQPYILTGGPNGQLWTRHYSNDRRTLATANRIWDVPSGQLLKQLPLHDGFNDVGPVGVAISPVDSNLIATGCPSDGVRLWDREGNQIGQIPGTGGTPIGWLSFSAQGDLLAVRQFAGAVRIFETDTWTEVDAFPVPYPDSSVLFSPVDNNLFVAAGVDGLIRAYSVSRADAPDVSFDHTAEVRSLKFSPDGRLLAVGAADGSVLFWDIAARKEAFSTRPTGQVIPGRLRFHSGCGPDYVAFSPDSRYVAIAGGETVSVRDVDEWKIVAAGTFPESAIGNGQRRDYWAVCFSRDGKYLFGSNLSNNRVDVWDWPNRSADFRPLASHALKVRCLDVSNDGLLAGITFESLQLWKLPEMEMLRNEAPRPPSSGSGENGGANLSFSPDGQRLAYSTVSVKILDVAKWEIEATLPHPTMIEHVSWSPDGLRLAASDMSGTTKLWDVATKKTLATFRGSISAFSPDGTILAVGAQGSKYIGDTKHLNRVTLHHAPPLEIIDAKTRRGV